MYLVKAGHRIVSLDHLVMAEDAKEEMDPRVLPDGIVRVLMTTGRHVDFEGDAADVLRLHLAAVTVRSPAIRPKSPKPGQRLKGNVRTDEA